MRIIIHAGMHKTGSSALQRVLEQAELDTIAYWPQNPVGAEQLLNVAFDEWDHSRHAMFQRGVTFRSANEFYAARKQNLEQLEKFLLSTDKETVIISSESLSHFAAQKVQAMHSFFSRFSEDVTYCAFVRRPVAFLHSSFGQRLISGYSKFSLQWPNYQRRFGALDSIFGRDKVRLRLYRGASEGGPDIVDDFFDLTGLENPNLPKLRANPTRSLEAVALIFMFRSAQRNEVTPWEPNHHLDHALMRKLSRFGHQKLTFAKEVLDPILERNAEDCAWMSERLGESVLDSVEESERPIRSENDLITIAQENAEAFQEFVFDHIRASKAEAYPRIVHNIFTMRNHGAPRGAFDTSPPVPKARRFGLMHIPKCAGTSVVKEISRHFDPERVYHGYDNPTFRDVKPDAYNLMIGHVGFDLLTNQGCQIIALIRDPIERFLSHYLFWNRRAIDGNLTGPDVDLAVQLSLDAFVDELENPILLDQFQNVTTWTFASGIEPWRKNSLSHLSQDEVLQLAKDNLTSCAVVGRLENLPVFERNCSAVLGKGVRLNKANANPLNRAADEVAPQTIAKIKSHLDLDIQLYEWFSEIEEAGETATP